MVILDRCNGSFNILDDLSIRICAPNKTEDLNLNLFNVKTIIYELKTLTKHISCNCKCKFDVRKCNSYRKWNKDLC